MKPGEIENLSFSIIDSEAGSHNFTPQEWNIVRRIIHTSADFEYMESVRFHPAAVAAGIKAIKEGCAIVTDTNMARVGIRKGEISLFGGEVHCLIADQDVAERAKDNKQTRALAAMDKAVEMFDNAIYVIGNAPTALMRLMDLVNEKKMTPALVVGLPVGFVNAAESKAELVKLDTPFISNVGRKGGSNVAASVINALSIMAAERSK
jgi:precorrin-8X/cobalt-precorrin-8 methylmutase